MTNRLAIALVALCSVAEADPTVTNRDKISYAGQMACPGVFESQEVTAGLTRVFTEYRTGGPCFIELYLPASNPWGPDGDYDPKKRVSRARVKRDSECVVEKKKLVCD